MEYTKGEWKAWRFTKYHNWKVSTGNDNWFIDCGKEGEANAHLIAAAPLGYELAEFVARISATWAENGLLEVGVGDYTHMKQLALELKAKAEQKQC